MIEANESAISVDDIVESAKLYKVDIRELILESYVDEKEEQTLTSLKDIEVVRSMEYLLPHVGQKRL